MTPAFARYEVHPLGNRWQLFLYDGVAKSPLWPTYESREAAEAEKSARLRRDGVIREGATK